MTLECMGLEKSEAILELVDGQLPISVPGRQLYAACPGLRARAAMCVDGDVEEDGSNWVGDGGDDPRFTIAAAANERKRNARDDGVDSTLRSFDSRL